MINDVVFVVANLRFTKTQQLMIGLWMKMKMDTPNCRRNSWKQQIYGVIRGHKLQIFITHPSPPYQYITYQDRVTGNVNHLYMGTIICCHMHLVAINIV